MAPGFRRFPVIRVFFGIGKFLVSSPGLACSQDIGPLSRGGARTMDKKTVDYYIVRIYRKEATADPQVPALTGLVETQSGARHAFHSAQELWRILGAEPAGDDR